MKKLCVLLLAAVLVLTGCGRNGSPVLPPARVGTKGEMIIDLAERYTLESALADADAVARVTVGDWLGEDCEVCATFFSARVDELYAGDMPESFVLRQDGCSEQTARGYPLFTYGNEKLVFLKKGTSGGYENLYWIIGAFDTVLDVAYDGSGEMYFLDKTGTIGGSIDALSPADPAVSATLLAYVKEHDVLPDGVEAEYEYMFRAEELGGIMMSASRTIG